MSKNILFVNEVSIYLFAQLLLLLSTIYILVYSYFILKKWNFSSTSNSQYTLEQKSIFIVVIIHILLIIKIILLPYFIHTLNIIHTILPGAMCGAGVIEANIYGEPLLFLKVVILFLSGTWLIIHKEDIKYIDYPYFKNKFRFLIPVLILIMIEAILDYLFFFNISTVEPVICCSSIYGINKYNSSLFSNDTITMLILFYLLFALLLLSNRAKNIYLSTSVSIIFLYIAHISIINFFGTYIYELPTHKCPFCMFQYHYNYIGYFIYSSLFMGLFFAFSSFFITLITKNKVEYYFKYSTLFLSIFVSIVTIYVIIYYFKNGVFL